jgi:hypothetical protein
MQKIKLKSDIIVTLPSKKTPEEIADILLHLELKLNKIKSIFFPKNNKYFNIFVRFHFDGTTVEEIF